MAMVQTLRGKAPQLRNARDAQDDFVEELLSAPSALSLATCGEMSCLHIYADSSCEGDGVGGVGEMEWKLAW